VKIKVSFLKEKEWVNKYVRFVFHIPTFITLGVVVLVPVSVIIYLSFTSYQLGLTGIQWIGLENYLRLPYDERFVNAIWHSFYFVGGALFLELLLGMGFALLLNNNFRGRAIYRILLLLPMMSIPTAIGMAWRMMYNRSFGVLSHFVTLFGLQPIPWLSSAQLTIPALIIVDVWHWSPFVMIILLAGLHSLPTIIYEAAAIDGASKRRQFLYLTLPLMKSYIIIAVVLRGILAFKTFDKVWVMTQGGPNFASELLNVYLYTTAFLYFNFGYACAVGVIFLGIMTTLVLLRIRT